MLLNYLKKINKISDDYFDSIRIILDEKLHYFGEHFKNPSEFRLPLNKLKDFIYDLIFRVYFILDHIFLIIKINKKKRPNLLSSSYFNLDDNLSDYGFNVYRPPWSIKKGQNIGCDWELFNSTLEIKRLLKNSDFQYFLSDDFLTKYTNFQFNLTIWLKKSQIKGVIVPNDVSFFENVLIKTSKKLGIPTYVFLHGFPGRYNNIDDNRADFLVVWGEKLKKNFVDAGFKKDKILVAGHPDYNRINLNQNLKFDFSNILVLTKSLNGANHSDKEVLSDRGNAILYLKIIETVLKKNGVKKVRLRLHPSENSNWYHKYLNNEFYIIDLEPLHTSISSSSLVIGPTSTVFLESICHGVNYLVFEPVFNSLDILNNPIVPPFDGSDMNIPIANSEEKLNFFLRNKIYVNPNCIFDYLNKSLDLSFLDNLKF
jgi:hypothetical protein